PSPTTITSRFLSTHSQAQCSIFLDAGSNPSLPVFPGGASLTGATNRVCRPGKAQPPPGIRTPPWIGDKKNPANAGLY
ncbi:hypothetical protein DP188_21125, partial [Enterobacter hormaechei subsp. steigerwaltii]